MIREALSISPFRHDAEAPCIVRGAGCHLFDDQGRRYLDMTGGSGAINLGHGHPEVLAAMARQAAQLVHLGWNIDHPWRRDMLEKLAALLPYDEAAVMGAVTGAEAIEVALKIARAATGRLPVVYFQDSFHGKSQGALAVTSNPKFRRHLVPTGVDNPMVSVGRLQTDDEAGIAQWVDDFDHSLVQQAAAGRLPAAVVVEPIQAAEGIQVVPEPILRGLLGVARRHGVLSIFDEIYTGFGRTGRPFVANAGLRPDLLVMGKALANGLPLSAVAGRPELVDVLGYAEHSSTFTFPPLATAVAGTVLEVMIRTRVWDQAAVIGARLCRALQLVAERTGCIHSVRGRGLMLAFDLVAVSEAAAGASMKRLQQTLLRHGIIVRTGGVRPTTVKLTPPLVFGEAEQGEFLAALESALNVV